MEKCYGLLILKGIQSVMTIEDTGMCFGVWAEKITSECPTEAICKNYKGPHNVILCIIRKK